MIDPAVAAVLRSKYAQRIFFMWYGFALALSLSLLCALPILFPSSIFNTIFGGEPLIKRALENFLGNFASAIAVLLVTYAFFVYLTPPGLRNAKVVPLRSAEIAEEIVNLQLAVSDYWFWGRSGTYFRNVVLPKLNLSAARERRHVFIRIVLPDVTNVNVCRRYASLRGGLGEAASAHTLPANVLATLFRLAVVANENPYVKVEAGLCKTVPVLRFDLSNLGGVITRDAKELPALLVNAGNPYFEMMKDAVENELSQSLKVLDVSGSSARSLEDFCKTSLFADLGVDIIAEANKLLSECGHRYG